MATARSCEARTGQGRDAEAGVWHSIGADDTPARLSTPPAGLADAEARQRLDRYGRNAVEIAPPTSLWKILVLQFRGVVVLLLVGAAVVALLSGDPLDATAILVVLALNALFGFATELRSRRAMEALLRMEALQARVVRAGTTREIDAAEVVPGDLVQVTAGDVVPADARLLDAAELRLDEAALTGESMPVAKQADIVLEPDTPLAERVNMLYKATTVVAGEGRAIVVATGMATEFGGIGRLVGSIPEEKTPLERRLDVLGRRLVWLALGAGAVVAALAALQGVALIRVIEAGIALAVAAVPEGLPAVATITLAVGVRRMARRRALIRRLPAVEALGSVTVICTDKTGTLTTGAMTVTALRLPGRQVEITGAGFTPEGEFREAGRRIQPAQDAALRLTLTAAVLPNAASLAETEDGWGIVGDPTDGALLVAAAKAGLQRNKLLQQRPTVAVLPFTTERRLAASFHRTENGGLEAFVKGAPAPVLERCGRILAPGGEKPLAPARRDRALGDNATLAERGLRVIALAYGPVAEPNDRALRDLTFVGFAGMIDPPAPGVRETIGVFRRAGIRTVMLTGDQLVTARVIGRELGVVGPEDEVVGGRELERIDDAHLQERLEGIGAFCRVSPESKLRIITAYQRGGDVVAMLGDGVNDAAALKKADVGVAMGRRGTDVARDAASVVLQDDRFQTIGAAVEEGRVIFDNIRKFVFYLFSCNMAEVLVLVGAGLAGLPLPLTPFQILWLNLVTDTFPALALAFEPAEPDIMRRPPRDPEHAILSRGFLRAIAFYGALITAVTLAAFLAGHPTRADNRQAITMSFMTLALAQAFHLGNARAIGAVVRADRIFSNRYAIGAVILVTVLQVGVAYLPPLRGVLEVATLTAGQWLIVFGLAATPALIGQALKLYWAHRDREAS
jgi:P-type Ca2+ transporter type 2C